MIHQIKNPLSRIGEQWVQFCNRKNLVSAHRSPTARYALPNGPPPAINMDKRSAHFATKITAAAAKINRFIILKKKLY